MNEFKASIRHYYCYMLYTHLIGSFLMFYTPVLTPSSFFVISHKFLSQIMQHYLKHWYNLNICSTNRRTSSSFKHNASFVSRLPTIRRNKPPQSAQTSVPSTPLGDSLAVRGPLGASSSRVGRYTRQFRDVNHSAENMGKSDNDILEATDP